MLELRYSLFHFSSFSAEHMLFHIFRTMVFLLSNPSLFLSSDIRSRERWTRSRLGSQVAILGEIDYGMIKTFLAETIECSCKPAYLGEMPKNDSTTSDELACVWHLSSFVEANLYQGSDDLLGANGTLRWRLTPEEMGLKRSKKCCSCRPILI